MLSQAAADTSAYRLAVNLPDVVQLAVSRIGEVDRAPSYQRRGCCDIDGYPVRVAGGPPARGPVGDGHLSAHASASGSKPSCSSASLAAGMLWRWDIAPQTSSR